jgi:hypothetical protein
MKAFKWVTSTFIPVFGSIPSASAPFFLGFFLSFFLFELYFQKSGVSPFFSWIFFFLSFFLNFTFKNQELASCEVVYT